MARQKAQEQQSCQEAYACHPPKHQELLRRARDPAATPEDLRQILAEDRKQSREEKYADYVLQAINQGDAPSLSAVQAELTAAVFAHPNCPLDDVRDPWLALEAKTHIAAPSVSERGGVPDLQRLDQEVIVLFREHALPPEL